MGECQGGHGPRNYDAVPRMMSNGEAFDKLCCSDIGSARLELSQWHVINFAINVLDLTKRKAATTYGESCCALWRCLSCGQK